MDLKKLKREIDSQKKSSNLKREKLGEKVEAPVARDSFLHELLISKDQGKRTNASERVRKVSMVAEGKTPTESPEQIVSPSQRENSQKQKPPVSESSSSPNQTLADAIDEFGGGNGRKTTHNYQERDDLFYKNMEEMKNKMRSMGMSEGDISSYVNKHNPPPPPTYNPQSPPAAPLNEGYVVEVASKKVEEFLNENFARVVSEAMKDTILETYKSERVLESLKENKKMIKDVVFEVIKEIQEHQKRKKST